MNPWFLYLHLHYIYAEPCYLGRLVEYVNVEMLVVDELEDWSWTGLEVVSRLTWVIPCLFVIFINFE